MVVKYTFVPQKAIQTHLFQWCGYLLFVKKEKIMGYYLSNRRTLIATAFKVRDWQNQVHKRIFHGYIVVSNNPEGCEGLGRYYMGPSN